MYHDNYLDGGSGMSNTVVTARSGLVDHLLALEREIRDSIAGAQAYLKSKLKLTDPDDQSVGGGWSQFLNEYERTSSATGTAHGIISLIACGESPDSEIITLAKRFILNNSRCDGGWTKPNLFDYFSLTRITGLALRALLDTGEPFANPVVADGIAWLIKAQNYDGGWGNMTNDQTSDVTSTSFALQALARIPGLRPEGREAINQGRTWLLKVKNQDYSWGYTAGRKGTIAHTSEAVEGLLASGEDRSALSSTYKWLVQNIHEDSQFIERYSFNIPPLNKDMSINWTQVSRERGLIALLRLGSSVRSPEVINSVQKILDRQVGHTYWRTETHPDSEPIWALKEAVISFRMYLDLLERDRAAIVLSEELSCLKSQIESLHTRITHLENHISRSSAKARFLRFLSFMTKPVSLLVLVTGLLIAFYLLLRNLLVLPQYAEILLAVLAIVSVILTLYQIIKPFKLEGRKK